MPAVTSSLVLTHEPSPAGSLNGSCLGVHLLLQILQPSEIPLDGLGKLAPGRKLGLLRLVRRQVLPEEGMVDVSAAVKLQGGLQGDGGLGGFGRGLLGLKLGEGFLSGVEAVDVGLVVLGVVQGHDFLGDARLEGLR